MLFWTLTGPVLSPGQPSALRIVCNPEDINRLALFKAEVIPATFTIHSRFHFMDDFQGPDQLQSTNIT